MSEQINTEQKILEAAKEVFYKKGLGGARMSEIADKAKINKAMLHYYFRSKQKLFDRIFQDAFAKIIPAVMQVLQQEIELEEKIREVSILYTKMLTENPHLPVFVLNAIQNDAQQFIQDTFSSAEKRPQKALELFSLQVKKAIEEGKIRPIDPHQLFLNLISMVVFPFAMRPMLMTVFGMQENEFRKFAENRKTAVPDFIINAIKLPS